MVMVAACAAVAWVLYLVIRPPPPIPELESDNIFEPSDGHRLTLLQNLRDARIVVPARPHPLPFRSWDPEYRARITRRTTFTCSTNSDRLRGVREYAPEPPDGVFRVAVIGDSITFGHGVNDHETYPHLLEGRLGPGFEVLNAGIPGQDSERALQDLQTRILPFRPHAVVVCTGVNETAYLPERFEERHLRPWLTEDQYRKEEEEFAANLEAIETVCAAAGARLVLLVPPVNTFSPYPDASRFCEVVRQVGAGLGVPCIDLQAAFLEVEQQRGLVLEHRTDRQTVVKYKRGRARELLSVGVEPDRDQYVSDGVYDFLDREGLAMVLSTDGSHPNAAGMELIAELLEPVIRDLAAAQPDSAD